MVKLPDRLECLFTASVDQRGDSYRIEIPRSELEQGEVQNGETYRIALLPSPPQTGGTDASQQDDAAASSGTMEHVPQTPPVAEGDMREVTIETIGDRGDGIAKVDRGYVVIVPETEPGDEVSVEITNVRENVAFAQVRDVENTSDDSIDTEESFADETLDELE
jgi:predicted RNA-binding protein with TRAM domain